MIDWDRFDNFSRDEFVCHCGCGVEMMKQDFMDKLQAMRTAAGFPFDIKNGSGYRCPAHNDSVSSTGLLGPHVYGQAADIPCRGRDARWIVVNHANFGFEGIGVAQRGAKRFLHVDDLMDPVHSPRPWVWSY